MYGKELKEEETLPSYTENALLEAEGKLLSENSRMMFYLLIKGIAIYNNNYYCWYIFVFENAGCYFWCAWSE